MNKFLISFFILGFLISVSPVRAENDVNLPPRNFQSWLSSLKSEMVRAGISGNTVDEAFQHVRQPLPRVIELDRNQPEFKLTLTEYLQRVVPAKRIKKAKSRYQENKQLLLEVAAQYNVQPRFILALWGIETDFGRISGGFDVIDALVTLIYDGRREKYFKKELIEALKILEEQHITVADMKGSWAGAMGQPQFMPSSFNNFAVDYDGDGKKDIWGNKRDVFASIANYLSSSGWRVDETWGRQVKLPKNFNYAHAENETRRSLAFWQAAGVRLPSGGNLPAKDLSARILLPEGQKGPAYLVYNNFDTTLKWNKSDFFALAVGKLADGIGTSYTVTVTN